MWREQKLKEHSTVLLQLKVAHSTSSAKALATRAFDTPSSDLPHAAKSGTAGATTKYVDINHEGDIKEHIIHSVRSWQQRTVGNEGCNMISSS
jgi:hypothetical protein